MKVLRNKISLSRIRDILSRFHVWVFIAAMAGGIVFGIITPIGQEADGAIHFYRAYDASHGNLFMPFFDIHDRSYLLIPANTHKYPIGGVAPDQENGRQILDNTSRYVMEENTATFPDPREYSSIYYYPAALGLRIGMMFSLSVRTSVAIAHILNALQYAVLVALTVRLMPFFKTYTAVIALSPVCIFQAASFSYDGLLNGLCFLVVALILHYAYGTDRMLGANHMLPVGILLALIYLGKYVYITLGLLVFLIPKKRFGDTKKYIKIFIVALLPLVLVLGQRAIFASIVPSVRMGEFAGLETTEMTQLAFVLSHPLEFFKVLGRTIYRELSNEIININILGWLTYTLEPLTYLLPVFWMGVFLLDKSGKPQSIEIKTRIFSAATAIITWLAVALALYFFDPLANVVGTYYINGLQGRYFVACLPLLAIACLPQRIGHNIKAFDKKALAAAFVFLMWAAWIFYVRCIGNGVFGWNGVQL